MHAFLRRLLNRTEEPDEMRWRVLELSERARKLFRAYYDPSPIDTSAFQEAKIFRPAREALGWTEEDGWRRNPAEIEVLRGRLAGVTDTEKKRALLHEILHLRYPSSAEFMEQNLEISIHAFRWLDANGLIQEIDKRWVLFAPTALTAPAFEFLPSFEIAPNAMHLVLNSVIADKSLQRIIRKCSEVEQKRDAWVG